MPKPTNWNTPEMQLSVMDRRHESHNLVTRAGMLLNLTSVQPTNVLLLDMSYWQGDDINWDILLAQVDGVILRACYGTWQDTLFDWYYEEIVARGVPIGAYHYIIGNQTANSQVLAFKQAIAGKELRLGAYPDIEDQRPGTALTKQIVMDYIEGLALQVQNAKAIYTAGWCWNPIMGNTSYGDYDLWVANYDVPSPVLPNGWTDWQLWQYTSKLYLDGYSGRLDGNYFAGNEEDFVRWYGGIVQPPQPLPEPLYQVEIITAGLYIRKGASTAYPIVRTALRGEILNVYQEVGTWLKVGQGQYCSGNPAYVKKIIPPPLTLEERVSGLERRVSALEDKC